MKQSKIFKTAVVAMWIAKTAPAGAQGKINGNPARGKTCKNPIQAPKNQKYINHYISYN